MKTTHYVSECGSPRWECGVEVLVREVCAVTLAVAVLSLPRTAPLQDTELLGLATLSLTTVSYIRIHPEVAMYLIWGKVQ